MIVLHVEADAPPSAMTEIKLIAARFPGTETLEVVVARPCAGQADLRLTLGDRWRYDASPACLAALAEFGSVEEPAL